MHFYLWTLKFTSNFPYTASTGRVGNLTGAFPAAVTASAMHSAAMLWDFLHAKMPVTHLLQEVQGTYVGENACTHFLKRRPFSFFHAGNLPCGTLNECTSRVGTILVAHTAPGSYATVYLRGALQNFANFCEFLRREMSILHLCPPKQVPSSHFEPTVTCCGLSTVPNTLNEDGPLKHPNKVQKGEGVGLPGVLGVACVSKCGYQWFSAQLFLHHLACPNKPL